ncbi:MAG: class D sortase [Eubacteriales bacterium]|nr:class D sortase [Eubacteriales bacterium]
MKKNFSPNSGNSNSQFPPAGSQNPEAKSDANFFQSPLDASAAPLQSDATLPTASDASLTTAPTKTTVPMRAKPPAVGPASRRRKPRPPKKKRSLVLILLDLLIVGCLLAAGYLYGRPLYNNWRNDQKTIELMKNIAAHQVDPQTGRIGIWIDPKANPVAGEGRYDTPEGVIVSDSVKHSGPVFVEITGQMTIPTIDLNMPIAIGCDSPQLQVALGWYTESTPFGEEGNSVVLGHRMVQRGRHFNRLDELKKGDVVKIATEDKIFTYRVTENIVVTVYDLFDAFSFQPGQHLLTLQTCTNIDDNTRIIIHCDLEKVENVKKDTKASSKPVPKPTDQAKQAS